MKSYGFGAVNKAGETTGCLVCKTRQEAEDQAAEWNRDVTSRFPEYGEYKAVELFYKAAEQS